MASAVETKLRIVIAAHFGFHRHRPNQLLPGQIDAGIALAFHAVDRRGDGFDLLILPIGPTLTGPCTTFKYYPTAVGSLNWCCTAPYRDLLIRPSRTGCGYWYCPASPRHDLWYRCSRPPPSLLLSPPTAAESRRHWPGSHWSQCWRKACCRSFLGWY